MTPPSLPGRYRKKPVVIEAMRFTFESSRECLAFMGRTDGPTGFVFGDIDGDGPYLRIETREGTMKARVGDWIIRGVQNELYPCKSDIFEATYEPAD